MTILGFPVCEYLCLAIFMVYDAYSWHSRLWVVTVPCHISCLFIKFSVCGYLCLAISMPLHVPVLGFSGCEWLLCLAVFHAWLWWLFLAFQAVSGYCALPYFMSDHDAYSWLSREWVAHVPCHVSCLFIIHTIGPSLWVSVPCYIYASSWCLFLAFKAVSGYCTWPYFMPDNNAFQAVRGYCALPYFMPDSDAFSWLSRKWVATVFCHILCLFMIHAMQLVSICVLLYLCLFMMLVFFQGVSGYCALPYIMPTHDASCLFRVWVASVPCNILCLFIIPLGFPGCEWLLCLAIFYAWA